MDGRTGSITVTALVGTGLATLTVALTGVAGLSGDLQAAAVKNSTPALTPGEELRDTHHGSGLVLRDACDKTHHKKKSAVGGSATATTPTTPGTTPASATNSRAF